MSRKRNAILQAIAEGQVTLTYKSPDLAEHDRSTFYYHRNKAALIDPRAMAVVIRLSGPNVILDFCPEDSPLAD